MKNMKGCNPLSANITKWSNTLKQFVPKLPSSLSVSDHFVGLALKGLTKVLQTNLVKFCEFNSFFVVLCLMKHTSLI